MLTSLVKEIESGTFNRSQELVDFAKNIMEGQQFGTKFKPQETRWRDWWFGYTRQKSLGHIMYQKLVALKLPTAQLQLYRETLISNYKYFIKNKQTIEISNLHKQYSMRYIIFC
jgi:hypothetical protein